MVFCCACCCFSRDRLCSAMDCNCPGSSVHGILQARILEWVARPSSRDLRHPKIEPASSALQADSLPTEPTVTPSIPLLLLLLLSGFSCVRLCATPETAAHQAPPSLGFSRQERWSGLPLSSPVHESEK